MFWVYGRGKYEGQHTEHTAERYTIEKRNSINLSVVDIIETVCCWISYYVGTETRYNGVGVLLHTGIDITYTTITIS